MIRVLIADHQYLTRRGLACLLADTGIKVVGEVDNTEDMFAALTDLQPDVLLFDYYQTDHFSLADAFEVNNHCAHTKTLIISNEHDKANIFKAIDSGINCFLTKSCGEKEILDAVVATTKGEKFFCNKILNVILEKQFSKTEENCDPSVLSPRELEIIKLMAQGVATKELAGQLNLSPHTVYTHRKNIMKKLNVNSAAELILFAHNEGLV